MQVEGRRRAAKLHAGRIGVEVEREDDGRWLAEVPVLAGALALRILAERLEHGELTRRS
jgi:hypothetical protein